MSMLSQTLIIQGGANGVQLQDILVEIDISN
jgi:hypothetical protein